MKNASNGAAESSFVQTTQKATISGDCPILLVTTNRFEEVKSTYNMMTCCSKAICNGMLLFYFNHLRQLKLNENARHINQCQCPFCLGNQLQGSHEAMLKKEKKRIGGE